MDAHDNKTGGRGPSELYIYVIRVTHTVVHDSSLLDSDFSETHQLRIIYCWLICVPFHHVSNEFSPRSHSTKFVQLDMRCPMFFRPGETKTMVCPKARRTSTKTTSVRRRKVGGKTSLCWGCVWNIKSGTILLCEPSFIIHPCMNKLCFFRNQSWWLMMNWNISSTSIWLWNKAMSWGFPCQRTFCVCFQVLPPSVSSAPFSSFWQCNCYLMSRLCQRSDELKMTPWNFSHLSQLPIHRGYSIVTLNYPIPSQNMVGILYAIQSLLNW